MTKLLSDDELFGGSSSGNLLSDEELFGGGAPAPSKPRSVADVARDVGVTALKGAVGLPQAVVGLADIPTGGRVGKALEELGYRPEDAKKMLDGMYSEAQQEANRQVREADGFVPTLQAALENPSTIATTVGESLPQMLGGAGIARGIMAAAPKVAPWLAAAVGEGVLGAGSAASQIRSETKNGLLAGEQALSAVGSGVGTGLLGAAGGKLAQKMGVLDVDTMLATGKLAKSPAGFVKAVAGAGFVKAVAGFVKAVAGAGISEGVFEELPQSVQEQMWQNFALDKPLTKGVGNAAALGLLAGASTGGAGGGFNAAMASLKKDEKDGQDQAAGADATAQSQAPPAASASDVLGVPQDDQKKTEAEQALYEPKSITALDRVSEIDKEIQTADPAKAVELQSERDNITRTGLLNTARGEQTAPAASPPPAPAPVPAATFDFDAIEQSLTEERDATTNEIEDGWMRGGDRRRRTPLEGAIYDAVTTPTLTVEEARAIFDVAAAAGRLDLAEYAVRRAERAAESMGTTPGVSKDSPKYEAIKKDLERRKAEAIAQAAELRRALNERKNQQRKGNNAAQPAQMDTQASQANDVQARVEQGASQQAVARIDKQSVYSSPDDGESAPDDVKRNALGLPEGYTFATGKDSKEKVAASSLRVGDILSVDGRIVSVDNVVQKDDGTVDLLIGSTGGKSTYNVSPDRILERRKIVKSETTAAETKPKTLTVGAMPNTAPGKSGISKGAAGIAQRQANAANNFIESVQEQFGLSKEDAGKAWYHFVQNKLVKIDAVGGQYSLTDGRLWDGEVMRRAASGNQEPAKAKPNRRQIDATKDTLFQAIAKLGGMDTQELTSNGFDPKDITYETAAKVSKKTGKLGKKSRLPLSFGFNMPLHKKGGMSFDGVLEELKQHGYFPEDATKNDAIEAFRRELGGDAVMTPDAAMQQAEMQAEQEENDAIGYDDLSDREKALVDFHAENIYDEDSPIEAFKRGMKRDGATEDEINEAIKQTFGTQETGNNDSGGSAQGTGETRDAQGAWNGSQDGQVQESAEPDWLTGQTNEQDDTSSEKEVGRNSVSEATYKNWIRQLGSLGKKNGWDLFRDNITGQYVLMSRFERAGSFDNIDAATKYANSNKAKTKDQVNAEAYLELTGQTNEQAAAELAKRKADIAEEKRQHEELIAKAKRESNAKEKARRAAQVLAEREAAKKAEVDKAAEDFALGQAAPAPVDRKVTTEDARGQQDVFAQAKYAGPADVSSRAGQMELSNRAVTIAALKGMNEQLRKIAPDEAWADRNIEDAQNLDALRDQISQALVDANRGKPDVNPLRKELEELSGQELKDVFSKLNLAGKLMAYEERISALLMEDAAEVRAAISAVTGNPSESTAQPVKATTEAKAVEPAAQSAEQKIRAAFDALPSVSLGVAYPITVEHNGVKREFMVRQDALGRGKIPALHVVAIHQGRMIASDKKSWIAQSYKLNWKNELTEEGLPKKISDQEADEFKANFKGKPAAVDAKPKAVEPAQDGDWLGALFNQGTGSTEEDTKAVAQAVDKSARVDAAIAMLTGEIEANNAVAAELAARKYKQNKKQIELVGDGPGKNGSMSISAINESRRRRSIEAAQNTTSAMKKAIEFISENPDDAFKQVLDMESAVTKQFNEGFFGKSAKIEDQLDMAVGSLIGASQYSGKGSAGRKLRMAAHAYFADDNPAAVDAKKEAETDDGIRYSKVSDAPAGEELVAIHNLTSENVLHAAAIGGIPVPSIGITKLSSPFTDFGEITLIADKGMIDPENSVPVFDRDAYTARFPEFNYKKVTAKKADAFYERMNVARELGDDGQSFISQLWDAVKNARVQSPKKVADLFRTYLAPRMLYAKEVLGKEIKAPMIPIKASVFFGHEKSWRDFVKNNAELKRTDEDAYNAAAAKAIKIAANEFIDRASADNEIRSQIRSAYMAEVDRYAKDSVNWNYLDRAIKSAQDFGKKRVDAVALSNRVAKIVPQDDPGYLRWVSNEISDLFVAPTITLRGKEVEASLDNIVEAMTIGKTNGAEKTMTFGVGKTSALLGKRFKSIKEIQDHRNQVVSSSRESEMKKDSEKLLEEYRLKAVEHFTHTDWKGRIDTFAGFDAAMEALAKAGKGALTDGNIASAMRSVGFKNVPNDVINLARQGIVSIREASTDYFEAKPQRAVKLNEFNGAVVPNGTNQEVIDALKASGITDIRTYKRGDEEGRKKSVALLAKKIHAQNNNTLFSNSAEGATQSAPITRTEAESRIKSILGDKLGKVLIDSGIVTFTNKGNEYQGATYKDGSIVLNLDALSADNFDGIFAHEGFHSAIRDLVGEQTYAQLMKRLDNMRALGNGGQWFKDAIASVPAGTRTEHVTEEIAAYAVQGYVNGAKQPNVITRWVESLLSALRTAIIRRLPSGKLKSWAVNNLQPQDLANLAISGLKAKARGQLQAQGREATAFSKINQTDTPAFKKWFGKSAVVDADGKPLVVYHGTNADFTSFDAGRLGEKTGGADALGGFFFAENPDAADQFTWANGEKSGSIMPVYLAIKNPARGVTRLDGSNGRAAAREIEAAKAAGHDGIVFDSDMLGNNGDTWVAFRPEQIKSAIGNNGNFDGSNPDIRMSRATSQTANQTAAERADEIIQAPAATWRPVDAIMRGLTHATRFDNATAFLYDKAAQLIDRYTPEQIKAGVVSDYGVPEAVIDRRVQAQGRMRVQMRKAGELIDKLSTLTRAESRVAYEWMNNNDPQALKYFEAQLPEESVKVMEEVKGLIDQLSQEAVSLGQLSEDAFKHNRFEYLRRSYVKHTAELTKGETEARRRAIAILGDQYKGRGMTDSVDMAKFRNVAPEWWGRKLKEGQADKGLKGEKFIRLERRKADGAGVMPLEQHAGPGDTNPKKTGKLLEVVYWPAGEALPAKFADWENAGTWEVRDTKGKNLIVWRDFTKQERIAMGEIDEARYAIAKTLHGMIHDVETGRYLDWLATTYAKKPGEAIDGEIVEASERMRDVFKPGEWVQVPDTKIQGTSVLKYGKLAGRYIPGPVWNDVRQTVGFRFKPLGETYAAILGAWKTAKTALSPAVHTNNVMANFVMADWHDVTAGHVAKALRIIMGASQRDGKGLIGRAGNVASRAGMSDAEAAREVMNRYQDSGGNIGTWAVSELQKDQLEPLLAAMEKELGLAGETAGGQVGVWVALQKALQLRFPSAWEAFKPSLPGRVATTEARNLISLYEAEDQVFRLAAWLKAKEEGASDIAAGKVARKSFLDYHINAPWIQAMRNTAFPFVSFTYRSVPMLIEIAAKKPHKLMKLALVAAAVNALGYMMSGGDEDDERKLLPEEKAGKIWGLVPKLVRMPWNDKFGDPVFLDIRRFVPVGDIFDTGSTNSAMPILPAMVPGGPLAILAELALNKTQFTGKPITLETDSPDEKAVKIADYLYKSLMPNVPVVPGTYSWTGITNASKGKTDSFGRELSTPQAVASAFGVKLGSYPKDVLMQNLKAKEQADLMEVQKNIRQLKREHQRNGIDDAEFEKKMADQFAKQVKIKEGFQKRINGR